jgi:hypothetical protein
MAHNSSLAMYKHAALYLLFFITTFSASAQKWLPGHFTDNKGVNESGLIRVNPSGKGPIKFEGYIEFKEDDKANPYKLSASDIKSFVIGQDSFVIAHAPANETWAKMDLDFVRVMIDEEPFRIYSYQGGSSGGGKSGISVSPNMGVGVGGGGYGGGVGGGIGINLGGGGGGKTGKLVYYYGATLREMKQLDDQNFVDIMSDVMADQPDVVERIHNKEFTLKNIEKLVAYYKSVQQSSAK